MIIEFPEKYPSGAEARHCFVAVTARLKPCPFYKTSANRGLIGFFAMLGSRALSKRAV
jgi:hypothetical protein